MNIFHELSLRQVGFREIGQPVLFMFLLTSALVAVSWTAAWALKLTQEQRVSFILSVAMINVGNFGLSLIFFTYGPTANDSALLTFVAFNIPLTTLAIYFSSDKQSRKEAIIDVLKIPIFHATLLALVFTSCGVSVPAGVHKITGYLSQATFPLFTFVFGMQLAEMQFTRTLLRSVSVASVLRLLVSPVLAFAILTVLGVTGMNFRVGLVQTSTPAPILPLMYAIRFNRSPDLLAATIIVTTLLSALTLPLVIALAG
ncbi:MAG: AEC family transporter [Desulfuromonadales bacterium]|nr:AEC family transporter [Desulfuromonadales bacterium]